MPHFVALLRGVNVGGNKRVPMAEFRAQLEARGFNHARTLLNSGNAVFAHAGKTTGHHATAIQALILEAFGVDAAVIVKSAREFDAIHEENPFLDIATDPSRLLVAMTQDKKALADLMPLEAMVQGQDQMFIGKHAAYLWCAGGILESKAAAALLGKAGRQATSRNWATVGKLQAMLRDKVD